MYRRLLHSFTPRCTHAGQTFRLSFHVSRLHKALRTLSFPQQAHYQVPALSRKNKGFEFSEYKLTNPFAGEVLTRQDAVVKGPEPHSLTSARGSLVPRTV